MSFFHCCPNERITRRLTLLPVVLAVVAVGTATPPRLYAQQRAPATSHDPKAAKATQKQLSLRNISKDTITLELRLGVAPDCAANPPAATQTLPPGREWLIASGRPICWRRSDAKASPGMRSWHRHVLRSGEHLKLTI